MCIKLEDEKKRHAELLKKKINIKNELFQRCEENKSKMKKVIKSLRRVAVEEKKRCRKKNDNKVKHQMKKIKMREQEWGEMGVEEGKIPDEMVEMKGAKLLNEEEFEKIEVRETELCKIGDMQVDKDEEEVLKLHPKFAVTKKLDDEQFELNIECGFAKLRWEFDGENRENKGKAENQLGMGVR